MPQFRPRPTKRAQQLRNDATDAERNLWRHLSRRQLQGFKFSRQMPIGPFICDFLCRERMLVIELDGGQHGERTAQDAHRTRYLEQQGLTVLRFWNNDVLQNMDGVLATILGELKQLSPKSPLPLAGGDKPRSGEGVGLTYETHTHPQPPPASGRGLS
jgi:very-short-patch-repair endonuclease